MFVWVNAYTVVRKRPCRERSSSFRPGLTSVPYDQSSSRIQRPPQIRRNLAPNHGIIQQVMWLIDYLLAREMHQYSRVCNTLVPSAT